MLAPQETEYAQAIAAFTTSLALEPRSQFTLRWRAEAYLQSGNADRALADSVEAIRLWPNRVEACALCALILQAQHKSDEAIGQAEAVIAANPTDARAYTTAGAIYAASDKETQAMRAFDQAVE